MHEDPEPMIELIEEAIKREEKAMKTKAKLELDRHPIDLDPERWDGQS
jgi:hypothetical protein